MKTSTNGIKFITQWEGTILHAYKDSGGILTIGVGHTSAAGAPKVTEGMQITLAQSNQILSNDLKKVEDDVNRLVKVKLTQNQFDALVSFHFNTGALGRSSALKYLNQGNYTQAAQNLTLYNKVGTKTIQGLVNRRTAEKKLFLTPDPSVPTAGPVAGGIVVGGGAATATTPHHLWPWIIGGTVALAIIVYLGLSIYEFNKHTKDVTINVPSQPEAK